MKNETVPVYNSNKRWMSRLWNSVCLVSVGRFASQASSGETYGLKAKLNLALTRVNGKLRLMGRNETMKMLILTPHVECRNTPSEVRPKRAKAEHIQLS